MIEKYISNEQTRPQRQTDSTEDEKKNLPDKEFKVMIINMHKELRKITYEQCHKLEVLNKETENIFSLKKELKNIITKTKIH